MDLSYPQSVIDVDSHQEDINSELGETDEQELSKFHHFHVLIIITALLKFC